MKKLYNIGVIETESGKRGFRTYCVEADDIYYVLDKIYDLYVNCICDVEIQSIIKNDAELIKG